MPGSPAVAIAPEANGPTAKPTVKTAPAVAAPAGPFRSEAQAVHELIAKPAPTPIIKRPANNMPECCERSIATVPNRTIADPAHATGAGAQAHLSPAHR